MLSVPGAQLAWPAMLKGHAHCGIGNDSGGCCGLCLGHSRQHPHSGFHSALTLLYTISPQALWKTFYKDTEMFWFKNFRYSTQPGKKAGTKGWEYALFRDALPDALRLFRARKEGKPLDEIPPVEYLYRKREFTTDGQPSVRAVKGFVEKEVAKDVGTKRAYNCSKCKQPKKKSCICKTASQAVEKIADAPDEAVEASVQATGSTGIPVKKRKRSPSADGRRTRSKIKA